MWRLLVLLGVSGCAGAGGAAASAAINTATAVAVSGVRRAQGDCYTPCNPGHACNHATGTCEPLPCRGECRFDERCEQTYLGDKCVPLATPPPPTPSP